MNGEQFFWLSVIVILNVAAYLVGRKDGRNKGYEVVIKIFKHIAPAEMEIILRKVDAVDPDRFAEDYVRKVMGDKIK